MPNSSKRFVAAQAAAILLGLSGGLQASSHREAPFIATMPSLDGTDFYMFRSYETGREDTVTLIANYYPLQDAYGGPNYFNLDDEAVYEIHIDNDGDSIEDITFSFDFSTVFAAVGVPVDDFTIPVPLVNVGGVGPGADDTDSVNVRQEYAINYISGDRRTGVSASVTNAANGDATFRKPVDNIGAKSIPDYSSYADDHIYMVSVPGCAANGRVFVGQRREGFAVNLGAAFDLVNLNPLGAADALVNPIGDKNVTTIALEIPIDCLQEEDPVIGAWTTASKADAGGSLKQVSRLGFPLVNELVIGLPDKDKFNASEPKDDAQFAFYVGYPSLPYLLEVLFGEAGAIAPLNLPRTDLVQAITGVKGLNTPQAVTDGIYNRSAMLRLNTSIDVTPVASQASLGVLADDLAGFPNGRRPGDDVVDVALRVMMGALVADSALAPNNTAPFTDQVAVSAADFDSDFPYLLAPIPGAGSN